MDDRYDEAAMDGAGELERLINARIAALIRSAAQSGEYEAVEAYQNACRAIEEACDELKLQRGWS